MSSRAARFANNLADRYESSAVVVMVACRRCVKKNVVCRLASLSERCQECIRARCYKCEPEEVPLPDFSKIDAELARLEKEEEEAEALLRVEETIAEEALTRARRIRDSMDKMRKSRRRLRREEKKLFAEGLSTMDDLEALEARSKLAGDAMLQHPEAAAFLPGIDWNEVLAPVVPSSGP